MLEEQKLAQRRYLAGLWEGGIDDHLLWYARKRNTERALDITPSWSRASVDSPVEWFSRTLADFELVDEDSCTVDLERTHVYQTAKSAHRIQGYLVLTSEVASSGLTDIQFALAPNLCFPWWTMHQPRLLGIDDDDDSRQFDHDSRRSSLSVLFNGPTHEHFSILRLCSLRFLSGQQHIQDEELSMILYCLLLKYIQNPFGKEPSGLWRRVGIAQIPASWFSGKGLERMTVTVV